LKVSFDGYNNTILYQTTVQIESQFVIPRPK